MRRWKRPELASRFCDKLTQSYNNLVIVSRHPWIRGLLWLGSLLRCPSLKPGGGLAGVSYEPFRGPPPSNSGPAAMEAKPPLTKSHRLRPGQRAAPPLVNCSQLGQGLRTISWGCGRVKGPSLQTPQQGPPMRMMPSCSPLSVGPGVLLRTTWGAVGGSRASLGRCTLSLTASTPSPGG